jgi:O-antigen ligase
MRPSLDNSPGRTRRTQDGTTRPGGELRARLVLAHLTVLIVGASWGFGGMSPGMRTAAGAWATVGIVLFLFVMRRHFGRAVRHLWPLLAFDAMVAVSAFNPGFAAVPFGDEVFLQVVEPKHGGLPSAARPAAALEQLWLLNGIVLSCYNVFAIVRRRHLRVLLGMVAANSLAIAMLGTFQKLSGAKGIWFGAIETPQPYFFGTFVYHNHWGAFTILNVAACLGLLFHVVRRNRERDLWHSPVLAGAVAVVLLAATAPLSGSRSSTILLTLFVAGALVHFLADLVRARRHEKRSATGPVLAIICAAAVAMAAIGWMAGEVIRQRARHTAKQVEQIRAGNLEVQRVVLYRDTWRTAMEKPWFGWGLASYPHVFQIYNSQRPVELWFGQPYYRDAHSDWLQWLAETGFVGTGLLAALMIAPIVTALRRGRFTPLPRYLIAGAGLVVLYATVEFPFANLSVLIAFWMSLYVAVRYALLEREAEAHA